jgi:hypothetical protein
MNLLFIDESGDYGLIEGGSKYFVLAGVALPAQNWKEYFWQIQEARRWIVQHYAISFQELKGKDIFAHKGPFFNSSIRPLDLERIYERLLDLLCDTKVELFAGVFSKTDFLSKFQSPDLQRLVKPFNEHSWREFLRAYDQYLVDLAESSDQPQNGIVYFDRDPGQEKTVRKVVREFARAISKDSSHPSAGIIEDPILRDSKESFIIQMADILAYSVYRLVSGPNNYDVIKIGEESSVRLKQRLRGVGI